MDGPGEFALHLFLESRKLPEFPDHVIRIELRPFTRMVRVCFGRIDIDIHFNIPGKLHQALSLFMGPSAVKALDIPSRVYGRIIQDPHRQETLAGKRREHHLQSRHSSESRIRVLSQDVDISFLSVQRIGVRLVKHLRIQPFFPEPQVRLVPGSQDTDHDISFSLSFFGRLPGPTIFPEDLLQVVKGRLIDIFPCHNRYLIGQNKSRPLAARVINRLRDRIDLIRIFTDRVRIPFLPLRNPGRLRHAGSHLFCPGRQRIRREQYRGRSAGSKTFRDFSQFFHISPFPSEYFAQLYHPQPSITTKFCMIFLYFLSYFLYFHPFYQKSSRECGLHTPGSSVLFRFVCMFS